MTFFRCVRAIILAVGGFGMGATAALAQPAVSGVKPTADGYDPLIANGG